MRSSTLLALALSAGVFGLAWSTRRRVAPLPVPDPLPPASTSTRDLVVGDIVVVSTRSLPPGPEPRAPDSDLFERIRITEITENSITGEVPPGTPIRLWPPQRGRVTVPRADVVRIDNAER